MNKLLIGLSLVLVSSVAVGAVVRQARNAGPPKPPAPVVTPQPTRPLPPPVPNRPTPPKVGELQAPSVVVLDPSATGRKQALALEQLTIL